MVSFPPLGLALCLMCSRVAETSVLASSTEMPTASLFFCVLFVQLISFICKVMSTKHRSSENEPTQGSVTVNVDLLWDTIKMCWSAQLLKPQEVLLHFFFPGFSFIHINADQLFPAINKDSKVMFSFSD